MFGQFMFGSVTAVLLAGFFKMELWLTGEALSSTCFYAVFMERLDWGNFPVILMVLADNNKEIFSKLAKLDVNTCFIDGRPILIVIILTRPVDLELIGYSMI